MRWSATSAATAAVAVGRVDRRRASGPDRATASAASIAGEQRLADALAGQRVGGGGGVADEQGAPRR